MPIYIPGQNELSQPQVAQTPAFEDQLARFKSLVIDHISQSSPEMAAEVAASFDNEAEILTKVVEACTLVLQTRSREINEDALQMFAHWAREDNLDAVVSQLGLVRGENESDEQLKARYFLAPHAPAAGSGSHYRFEALTLGNRAKVNVSKVSEGVDVQYRFNEYEQINKDAQARRTAPGEVTLAILPQQDVDPDLALTKTEQHFQRHDVKPETDKLTVVNARPVNYHMQVKAKIYQGPDLEIVKSNIEHQLQLYRDARQVLGGEITPDWISHAARLGGAIDVEVVSPASAIHCLFDQVPVCSNISVEVTPK